MTIQVGDTLPSINLTTMTSEGPKPVSLTELSAGKKLFYLQFLELSLQHAAYNICLDFLKRIAN